jgi:hypothetical protein
MVKKMWAIVSKDGFKSVSKEKECTLAMKVATKSDCEIKQVWVTDKDPFENVRAMLLLNHIAGGKLQQKVADALKKDIQNFDNPTRQESILDVSERESQKGVCG